MTAHIDNDGIEQEPKAIQNRPIAQSPNHSVYSGKAGEELLALQREATARVRPIIAIRSMIAGLTK